MKTMLDERAKTLLKTLVERYIADGQPVGSRTLSRASGLELSPATIRNVMADLEELGLIRQPHASAGRVPTDLGLRFFVNSLLKVRQLTPREREELAAVGGEHGHAGLLVEVYRMEYWEVLRHDELAVREPMQAPACALDLALAFDDLQLLLDGREPRSAW